VLIIVTDDQRYDTLQTMPKTRAWIAERGTTFTRGVATTPLCCPSRSSIFSGRYAQNHGNVDNSSPLRLDQSATLQKYLQDAGYTTAIVGKFLVHWSNTVPPPHFDRWTIFSGGYYGAYFNSDTGSYNDPNTYSTNYVARRAVAYIDSLEAHDARPWMLYVAPHAPHKNLADPPTPETKYAEADVGTWAGNPAVFESDRSDKPPWVQNRSYAFAEASTMRTAQQRTLLSVDDMVDAIFRRLVLRGEGRDTLVIFLSDNGYLLGEHGLREKALPYTHSIRVPFMIRWPGKVPAGAVDSRRFIANVDIAPSVLAAAGIRPTLKYPFDGKAMLSPTGLTTATHSPLYLEERTDPGFRYIPTWRSLRTGAYQYIEYYDSSGAIIFREYYDLAADPWQNVNVLRDGDPTNNVDTTWLSELLARYRTCQGSACP
jgi:arylsulfatase A-like enzyme